MQCSPARGRAGICFIGDVTGAAGEAKNPVVAGDALAGFQIGVDRAALGHAFAAEQFERVGLAGHGDTSGAQAASGHGQIAAAAILRVGPDAHAAFAGSGGKQPEFSRAGACARCHRAAVAGDGFNGFPYRGGQLPRWARADIGNASAGIEMRVGRTDTSPLGIGRAAAALNGWCGPARCRHAGAIAKFLPGKTHSLRCALLGARRHRGENQAADQNEIAVARRTTTKPRAFLNRYLWLFPKTAALACSQRAISIFTRKHGNAACHARVLLVMHCQSSQMYDRYHKRRPGGYNRKSPFSPCLAGFASVAIAG